MTAKVRFGRDSDEHRFDFTFDALTKEPAAPTSVPKRRAPPTGIAAASATATAAHLPDGGHRPRARSDSLVDGGNPERTERQRN